MRLKHEGTYQQLPNGKVRMVVMKDARRVYGPSAASKLEAKQKLREKQERIEQASKPRPAQDPTFGNFFYEQFPRLKRELAQTTYALYEIVYETLVRPKPIDFVRLSELRTEHVEEWLGSLPQLKPRSRWRYLQCIKAILAYAVNTKRIPYNPATPVKPGKIEEHDKRVLSPDETDKLLKLPMSPRMRKGLLLCLHGLRRAEACGIRFEDFDGDGMTIRRQALEVNGELIIREATKTGGTRWVPVNSQLKALLSLGEGYVLGTRSGNPLRPRNLAREWGILIKGTPYEGLTLHDLRSTLGTLLLEKGVDVRTAAEIMGHSPAMLARIYARSRKELKSEALSRVFA